MTTHHRRPDPANPSGIDLDTIHLARGSHTNRDSDICLMEAVAWYAGLPHSDAPKCVSLFLRRFGIALNDRAFIPLVVGTARDGKDEARRWLATDHAVRVATPQWLHRAGLTDLPDRLRGLDPITNHATYRATRDAISAVRDQTWNLRTERYDRIRAAAREAAKQHGVADAVGVAAADAVGAADPWAVTYSKVRQAVYDKVCALYEERFADLIAESWADGLGLFERLIDPAVAA